jgi:hypothetical protein
MVTTQETIQGTQYPSYISERQQQLLNNLFGTTSDPSGGAIDSSVIPPAQQVAQFTPAQQQAFQRAQLGLGSFEPYLAQTAGRSATRFRNCDNKECKHYKEWIFHQKV